MDQLTALLLSILIELPLVACATYALSGHAHARVGLVAVAATLLTHPWAWYLNTVALNEAMSFAARATIIELSVSAIEGALFRWRLPLTWPQALGLALVANLTSFGFGMLLWYLDAP